ncbi:MAG TPA: hypothetical protein VIG34_02940 [Xanthobacteraceae bacterium]|jgi:hypothetical protein
MTEFKDFLEDYRRTWEAVMNAGDVAPLSRFFHIPYFAVGADGAITLVRGEDEICGFNQTRLDLFRKDKVTRAFSRGCDVLTLGSGSAMIVANWELQRADGTVARVWRHFYNMARTPEGLKILVSTFSPGS